MHNEDLAWIEYQRSFSSSYDGLNYASGLHRFTMYTSHRLLEKRFDHNMSFKNVLEVGAGTGEHLAFVRHQYDRYTLVDHDERVLEIAKAKFSAEQIKKIQLERRSCENLEFPDQTFDRVIASHVLEHIYYPHLAIKEWARVLKKGGMLSILLPTDPGLMWRLGRHLGPRRAAIGRGVAYDYIMAREHVNSCTNLMAFLRHYFPNGQVDWWPMRIPSVDLNLFVAFHAVKN